MNLTKILAAPALAGAMIFGAVGMGGGVANAEPAAPAPLRPGHHDDDNCWPLCDDFYRGRNDWNRPDWRYNDWNWDKGHWWNNNRHDWWDDNRGAPPWGWGPPPVYQWHGGPPQRFNYWGYDVDPVFDRGFNQWGIWLFGLWIPIAGIGIG